MLEYEGGGSDPFAAADDFVLLLKVFASVGGARASKYVLSLFPTPLFISDCLGDMISDPSLLPTNVET